MEIKKVKAMIEAVLFANAEPLSLDRLSDSLELDKNTLAKLLDEIIDKFEKDDSGICIVKLNNNNYQMCAKPVYAEYIRKIMNQKRNVPLSGAAMEILAIVAYNQPVTKSFIENIRGVDCSGGISSLVNKNLIEEKGRLELPGKPLLYGTTLNFLKCFGISSLNDLQPIVQEENLERQG